MFSKDDHGLPPMKYFKGQEVKFDFNGETLQGIIEILDFGGSFENDFHSYDVYVATTDTLYKHIPEANIYL
jgi:hypothetical protein